MSLISPLDEDLALVYPRLAPVRLMELLHERGIQIVEVPDEEFETMGPNVLALGPRHALALEGNDETRRRMEAAGVEVLTYARRRDLAQGRRRPDVPDEAAPPRMNVYELFDAIAGDEDALRERARPRSGPGGEAERRRDSRRSCTRSTTGSAISSSRCSTPTRRSTSSTPPRSGGREGWRSCSTASPSWSRRGRRTASRRSISPRSSGRRRRPRSCSPAAPR